MKKLIFILSLILITGTVFSQTQQLKKNFTLLKGAPTLSLQGAVGVINFNSGDITLTNTSDNLLTLAGGTLALGTNSLTMTGSIAATGARVTKGWFTNLEVTNAPTVNGTSIFTAPVFATSVTLPSGDTTVTAVKGKVIFKTADSTLYVCRSTTYRKKWYAVW